jgi:hypothetical protein
MSGIDRLKISSSRWSEIGEGLRCQKSLLPACVTSGGAYDTTAWRVGRLLERAGLLERDTEQLDLDQALDTDDPMPELASHPITYRVAVGPHRGRKVLTLQTLSENGWQDGPADAPGYVAGFSLHAGVAVKPNQCEKLERLCRYICRPPVSEKRLFVTPRGDTGYSLKTPYRDGTTHVIFEPLDFVPRLAALVPSPRLNLTRFLRVFGPNSPLRARIRPARWGRGARPTKPTREKDRTAAEQRAPMRWAHWLKRVFQVDIETCPNCNGSAKVIACIEDPPVIVWILTHLSKNGSSGTMAGKPGAAGTTYRLASLNRKSISGCVPSVCGTTALVLIRLARQKRGSICCLIAAERVETDGIRCARGFGEGPGPVWHGSGYRWKSGNTTLILPIRDDHRCGNRVDAGGPQVD